MVRVDVRPVPPIFRGVADAIAISDGVRSPIGFWCGFPVAASIEQVYDHGMSSTATLDPAPAVVVDVASEVASLAGAANVVMARLVAVVAAAIAGGETDEAGMKTPAAWLAWRSGLSPERAGQLVKLAKVRDRYPLLFDAFERGVVSVDQMTELVKAPEWAERADVGVRGDRHRATLAPRDP